MTRDEKLLDKAQTSPQGLRFAELCKLAELNGYKLGRTRGSHRIYTKKGHAPLTLQPTKGGKAKAYQVRHLLAEIGA